MCGVEVVPRIVFRGAYITGYRNGQQPQEAYVDPRDLQRVLGMFECVCKFAKRRLRADPAETIEERKSLGDMLASPPPERGVVGILDELPEIVEDDTPLPKFRIVRNRTREEPEEESDDEPDEPAETLQQQEDRLENTPVSMEDVD